MKNKILKIYRNFDIKKLTIFFDELVAITKEYKEVFSKYTEMEFLNKMIHYKSKDFIIGHSDDFFEKEIEYYVMNYNQYTEKELILQVVQLIWNLCAYMTDVECPVCHQTNFRLLVRDDTIYEFCEECLFTKCNGKPVRMKEEMFPATREQILRYMKKNI